jgi:hypothetical protein
MDDSYAVNYAGDTTGYEENPPAYNFGYGLTGTPRISSAPPTDN